MYKTKLCLGTSGQFGTDIEQQIKLFSEIGFDGFFVNWERNLDIRHIKEYADSLGMLFQSIHAPFVKSDRMWEKGTESEEAIRELLECLKDCEENDVPIMVCHAIIGFDKHTPNECGINNYRIIVEKAKEAGVKIAFENTEGEEYLDALMTAFSDYDNVGFCWDTGHEMCYNKSRDMMKSYGDRIICTHLNDNMGIRDFGGEITFLDDLHLLPYDGAADWSDIAERLKKYGFTDVLTFELNKQSKPNRHENDIYDRMPLEEYICEAYKRACRFAMMVNK